MNRQDKDMTPGIDLVFFFADYETLENFEILLDRRGVTGEKRQELIELFNQRRMAEKEVVK
jgi:hypothetical protein